VEVFASRYTPLVMGLAVAVMLLPPLILPIVQLPGVSLDRIWDTWFYRGLVVLVISCPCALVISTPVAVVAGITTAVRRGVLVKGGEFLEAMANVRAIAFDKTGTLTVGTPLIEQLVPIGETNSRDLLSLAAALEVASIHPLAEAIRSHASSEEVEYSAATDCTVHHGEGVTGSVAGEPAWIGKPSWAAEQAELSDDVQQTVEGVAAAGLTTLVVGRGVQPIGVIGIADPIRPETDQVMAELRQHGVGQLLMLTGDGDAVAKSIADQAGLESYKAGLMPNEKADEVAQLKDGKGTVVMVGDGVNDSPAMARATVGISMASIGSQHAIATSDIALMSDDLGRIPWLIDHARRTLRVIRQNTTLAIMLKLLCLAATIAGFCSLWIAIAADTGATLLVTSNSLRLFSR
jgi:Cd2+/Zn2+-exporting ATPase